MRIPETFWRQARELRNLERAVSSEHGTKHYPGTRIDLCVYCCEQELDERAER